MDGSNSGINGTEERINVLKAGTTGIAQSEQQREKTLKKKRTEQNLRDMWD